MFSLTKEERSEMLRTFARVDGKTLSQAETVATLLSDDEADSEESILSLKFFYCLPENKDLLKQMYAKLSVDPQ